ncbi:MAG: 4Fe-4S binding protein [Actinomycetia bacterium]|nr:4Fe-4S binding protein [Actinomycetes bacterium]
MSKGFVVDLKRCIGCKACVVACKLRYELPEGVARRAVRTREFAETPMRCFLSLACNHCEHPACIPICPQAALSKDAEGRVIHDPGKCIGCRRCEFACPYDAICYDLETGTITKCDACATRSDGPRCVAACHAKALSWVDVDASFTLAAAQVVKDGKALLPDPRQTTPHLKVVR